MFNINKYSKSSDVMRQQCLEFMQWRILNDFIFLCMFVCYFRSCSRIHHSWRRHHCRRRGFRILRIEGPPNKVTSNDNQGILRIFFIFLSLQFSTKQRTIAILFRNLHTFYYQFESIRGLIYMYMQILEQPPNNPNSDY